MNLSQNRELAFPSVKISPSLNSGATSPIQRNSSVKALSNWVQQIIIMFSIRSPIRVIRLSKLLSKRPLKKTQINLQPTLQHRNSSLSPPPQAVHLYFSIKNSSTDRSCKKASSDCYGFCLYSNV